MRLAGRMKLGYYPFPPLLIEPLARLLHTKGPTARVRLLDPCCGEGTALKLLAEAITRRHREIHGRWAQALVSTWGIELDQIRAQLAAAQLDYVLATSYFSTTLSTGNGADRGWQLGYVNSLYDDGSEVLEGERGRQEVQFFKRTTERLCDQAIAIWVIPQHVLGRRGVAAYLTEHYDQQRCWRFPDVAWRPPGSAEDVEMYAQFKQVIWIGRKLPYSGPGESAMEAQIEAWARMGADLAPLSLEDSPLQGFYLLPNAPSNAPVKYFLTGAFNPDALARRLGQFTASGRPRMGIWSNEEQWEARFPDPRRTRQAVGHGLHAFKRGYVIAFAVAGLVNRAVLTGKSGRRLLVKGHTRKTRHSSRQDDGMEIIEKDTERFESSLWGLDLDTMQLILIEVGGTGSQLIWGAEHETMSMKDFLADFGDSLMDQVQKLNTPRYLGPHQVPWARRGFAYLKRRPLGKQLDAILAQVHALVNRTRFTDTDAEPERLDRLAEVAEMGAGKTYMAMVTAWLADLDACGCADLAPPGTRRLPLFPLVILSPAIMAPKWKRELEQTLPDARVLIVEKFGPRRGKHDNDEEESADERDLRSAQASASIVDGRTAFRQFDSSFTGEALGLVGSVDHAVACIQRDLETWREHYACAIEHNREAQTHQEGETWPLPLKPTHVLILTFHDARTMPAWMPVWREKPARVIDRESGKVRLLRRQSKIPEERTPLWYPACPSCLRLAKDDQQIGRALAATFDPEWEGFVDQRATSGRQLGLRLLVAEERLRHYLLSIEAYAALEREQIALHQGAPLQDDVFAHLERMLHAHLDTLPDYQRLRAERIQAEREEDSVQGRAWSRRLERFIAELPVQDACYRDLLCQQDQRFRELQRDCAQRIAALRTHLASTDETYRQLIQDIEAASDEWRRHTFRTPAYEAEARESTALYLTETALRGKKDYRVQHCCTECGEPLWQYVAKQPKIYQPYSVQQALPSQRRVRMVTPAGQRSYELVQWVSSRQLDPLPLPDADHHPTCVTSTWRRRYALARYLNDQYPGVFGMLIADEMHEGADKTALSRAREALARTCRHMLGLTGTLSNGFASSLFRLYYTLVPGIRAEFGYHDTSRWIRLHGKMQTITKSRYETPPTGTGSDSKRKISPGMPVTREIPGFNATGMGRVARVSSLTELSDVVENLVPYREDIHIVEMDDDLREAYQVFQAEVTRKMRELLREGDNSGLSPWYHALLTVGDLPWLRHETRTKHGLLMGVFPALPEERVWRIENALITYVQKQHLEGHRVLVFTEHTGGYDEQARIKMLLERYVRGRGGRRLKVAILRTTSTRRSMDRESWLTRTVESGVDVLICNPALVKVGLDLLAFPKIVYKSFPDKVTDFRQSAKRSRRPGQTEPVEVVILTYREALSLRLLLHMARKVLSSLMTEGQIATEGLVKLGFDEEADEGDFSGQVAREMVAALDEGVLEQTEDLAAAIQSVSLDSARIEQEQNQRLGEEANAAAILLEEIRQEPLVLPPPLPPLEMPKKKRGRGMGEAITAEAEPTAPPEISSPETPREEFAVEPPPVIAPTPVSMVTIVPLPVTEGGVSNPILAEAGVDMWAELRKLVGVGGKKKKGGTTRRK